MVFDIRGLYDAMSFGASIILKKWKHVDLPRKLDCISTKMRCLGTDEHQKIAPGWWFGT